MNKLTISQKIALETELKKTREASARNRLCVILGHDDGLSINELAKALRISHATVCIPNVIQKLAKNRDKDRFSC